MQIERYEREMKCFAIGGKWGDEESTIKLPNPQPLEVEIYRYDKPLLNDDDWNIHVYPYLESDFFPFTQKDFEEYSDSLKFFCRNYLDIVRGQCRGWNVAYVEITSTAVILEYDYPDNDSDDLGYTLWLRIPDDENLSVKIRAPRNRSGFSPVYEVWRRFGYMSIDADLGYMIRQIDLKVKDPTDKTNDLQRHNQIAIITEYTDI